MVPKVMPEPREILGSPAPLGQRVMLAPLAPLALPELKVILAGGVIPERPERPERPVPLVPEQLGPLALLVLSVRPRPLVEAC